MIYVRDDAPGKMLIKHKLPEDTEDTEIQVIVMRNISLTLTKSQLLF